ncbi:hypothetical protein R3P38DRAFT_2815996 [Favolaschia claudopus]|uniref:Uncharacterized protein n=1 Tax=Favolaschia claudopus TaxID=2862362 RepID=A0AAV9Z081_9AGAR
MQEVSGLQDIVLAHLSQTHAQADPALIVPLPDSILEGCSWRSRTKRRGEARDDWEESATQTDTDADGDVDMEIVVTGRRWESRKRGAVGDFAIRVVGTLLFSPLCGGTGRSKPVRTLPKAVSFFVPGATQFDSLSWFDLLLNRSFVACDEFFVSRTSSILFLCGGGGGKLGGHDAFTSIRLDSIYRPASHPSPPSPSKIWTASLLLCPAPTPTPVMPGGLPSAEWTADGEGNDKRKPKEKGVTDWQLSSIDEVAF